MLTVTELEKNMAMQTIASGVREPEDVAKSLGVPLGRVHNWCSTPQFRELCRRYGQELVRYEYDPQFVEEEPEEEFKPRPRARTRRPRQKQKSKSKPRSKPKPKPKYESGFKPKILRQPCWKRVLAIADVSVGISKSAVARKYEVSRRTIDRWCDDADVASQFKQGYRLTVVERRKHTRLRNAKKHSRARAVRLVDEKDYTYARASRATGVPTSTVQDDCEKAEVRSRRSHRNGSAPSGVPFDSKVDEAVELVRIEHVTYAEAHRRTGVPPSTIRRACDAADVRTPWKYERKSE